MLANQSHYYLLPSNIPPAWACAWGEDEYGLWVEFEYKSVVQRMRWISPRVFVRGTAEDNSDRLKLTLQDEIGKKGGYWLADTACTQALWEAVMGENLSNFKGDQRPVENVSWDDCQVFFKRINQEISDLCLGLPSEVQWEYACRAGTATSFWFGDTINHKQVNYGNRFMGQLNTAFESISTDDTSVADENVVALKGTAPVKTYPSNSWGLYEMHGNVFEWCSDFYAPYEDEQSFYPQIPKGFSRVLRGGSWFHGAWLCQSASRSGSDPSNRLIYIGFRLSRGQ